jgi:hypothetical protein
MGEPIEPYEAASAAELSEWPLPSATRGDARVTALALGRAMVFDDKS